MFTIDENAIENPNFQHYDVMEHNKQAKRRSPSINIKSLFSRAHDRGTSVQ
jgi:hypothetical protein